MSLASFFIEMKFKNTSVKLDELRKIRGALGHCISTFSGVSSKKWFSKRF
jgi:hypothetical protein